MSELDREERPTRGINLLGENQGWNITVGYTIAVKQGVPFVYTDELIAAETGRTPSEIIRQDSLARLKIVQNEVIRDQSRDGIEVWAAGETVINDPELVKYLRTLGTGVYLHASVEPWRSRITDEEFAGIVNPQGLDVAAIHEKRNRRYEEAAELTIDVDRPENAPVGIVKITPEEVAKIVVNTCVNL